jgi:hypothetical protein
MELINAIREIITKCEYLYPGIFMPEEVIVTVADRTPNDAYLVEHPKCFCFQFYDQEIFTIDGKQVYGKTSNYSKRFYVNGKVFTAEEIERDFADHHNLVLNAKDYGKLCYCRAGNWQPFDDNAEIYNLEIPNGR